MRILPDSHIIDIVPIISIWNLAGDLLSTYQFRGAFMRKRLSRSGGAKGGRKTQRKIRAAGADAVSDFRQDYGRSGGKSLKDK